MSNVKQACAPKLQRLRGISKFEVSERMRDLKGGL